MKTHDFASMIGGWFVGNFEPSAHKTDAVEVSYKVHKKGEKWPAHFHKEATEINLLVTGSMKIQDQVLQAGTIFILAPYEIADPEFYEDCHIVCVKTPGAQNDKYLV